MPQYDPILNSDFARIDRNRATEDGRYYLDERHTEDTDEFHGTAYPD